MKPKPKCPHYSKVFKKNLRFKNLGSANMCIKTTRKVGCIKTTECKHSYLLVRCCMNCPKFMSCKSTVCPVMEQGNMAKFVVYKSKDAYKLYGRE